MITEHGIDTEKVYVHTASGFRGRVEDWSIDPDGRVKVRVKDHWVFFDEMTQDEIPAVDAPLRDVDA